MENPQAQVCVCVVKSIAGITGAYVFTYGGLTMEIMVSSSSVELVCVD